MSFAPYKVKRTLGRALRKKDEEDSWWDKWGDDIGLAVLEAAVLCAPVVVAGSFELYVQREKARAKLEQERIRLEIEKMRRESEE